jgi:hypothetical protein
MKKIIDSNDVALPQNWSQLTPTQVTFVAKQRIESPDTTEFMTQCLLHFMGLRPQKGVNVSDTTTALQFNFSNGKEVVKIDSVTILYLFERIEWLNTTFGIMKPPKIEGYKSPEHQLHQTTLEQFVHIDKCYSDFMATQNTDHLRQFFALLYTPKRITKITDLDRMAVVYWYSALKIWLRDKYEYVFSGGYEEEEYEETAVEDYLIPMIASLNEGRPADNEAIKKGMMHEMLFELNRKIEQSQKTQK